MCIDFKDFFLKLLELSSLFYVRASMHLYIYIACVLTCNIFVHIAKSDDSRVMFLFIASFISGSY